jgi:hypothetical protein
VEEEGAALLKRVRRLMSRQTRARQMLQLPTRLRRLRPMSCLEEHPAQQQQMQMRRQRPLQRKTPPPPQQQQQQQQTETIALAGDNARDRLKSIQRRTSDKAFELNGE